MTAARHPVSAAETRAWATAFRIACPPRPGRGSARRGFSPSAAAIPHWRRSARPWPGRPPRPPAPWPAPSRAGIAYALLVLACSGSFEESPHGEGEQTRVAGEQVDVAVESRALVVGLVEQVLDLERHYVLLVAVVKRRIDPGVAGQPQHRAACLRRREALALAVVDHTEAEPEPLQRGRREVIARPDMRTVVRHVGQAAVQLRQIVGRSDARIG